MKHYEDLVGGKGRQIFYRAERYRADDLLKELPALVRVDDDAFAIHDLSMSGISFVTRSAQDWIDGIGRQIPLNLMLGDVPVFEGQGKVCRVEPTQGGSKVALQLTSGYLDVRDLIARHDALSVDLHIGRGIENQIHLVHPEYRRICADGLYALRQCREVLDRFDRLHQGNELRDNARLDDIAHHCETRLFPEWWALNRQAQEILRTVRNDPERLRATKSFTEHVLTPELNLGAIWNRSYTKPLGYPGDFQVMNYVYSRRPEGETATARLYHKLGLEIGEFVATRMIMMQRTIGAAIARGRPDGGPVRIASLGCGPAQEAANYLRLKELPNPVDLTLIDQDHDALGHAYEAIYPQVMRHGNRAAVHCLHASFSELLTAGRLFRKIPPQDLIYSVGLVDYLSQKRACKLVAALYEHLTPGGTIVIGNMKDGPEAVEWPLEFVADWSLIYRTEDDMRDMARLVEPAEIRVKADPTDRVYMLYVTKPE
ncbi:class I SAM-dependent methyltransferase [Oceanibacterium hippocampi]|uniref:Methyltransferase domain protein n=1 Tax=Oceanibacterium hippocampi TaxID=745714 RepID=A0A1Y5RBL9_9PROT|nr:class I SAM-dependent methyltransferase [Oceanibacterium hippocampi]SLN13487.1 hypothetical protein OCH7691_00226 [Oceanibacterium hippocampi]